MVTFGRISQHQAGQIIFIKTHAVYFFDAFKMKSEANSDVVELDSPAGSWGEVGVTFEKLDPSTNQL
jgi:hypothetical protein